MFAKIANNSHVKCPFASCLTNAIAIVLLFAFKNICDEFEQQRRNEAKNLLCLGALQQHFYVCIWLFTAEIIPHRCHLIVIHILHYLGYIKTIRGFS